LSQLLPLSHSQFRSLHAAKLAKRQLKKPQKQPKQRAKLLKLAQKMP
jgi:hypothetical protein